MFGVLICAIFLSVLAFGISFCIWRKEEVRCINTNWETKEYLRKTREDIFVYLGESEDLGFPIGLPFHFFQSLMSLLLILSNRQEMAAAWEEEF